MKTDLESNTISGAEDEYTQPKDLLKDPPNGLLETFKYLGPGIIVSSSIVGSGEVILTASLGAAVGYGMLWWVLLSCWSKSVLQAELARYVILSGDTYLRALNRIPGKIRLKNGAKVSWPVILVFLSFFTSITNLGGLIGGASLAILLIFPEIEVTFIIAGLAFFTMLILGAGGYHRLEKIMMLMVGSFTIVTIICFFLMQGTEYSTNLNQLTNGFSFKFYPEYAFLALAVYGYTGINSGEVASYTYWCIEKGYAGRVGSFEKSDNWVSRAHGWLRVLRTDVWVTLLILTLATIPFYFLGAGILHATDQTPSGQETIRALGGMYTETLGGWSLWLFATGAFFILYSTTISAVAAQSRVLPDYFIEFGLVKREMLFRRKQITKYWIFLAPALGFLIAEFIRRPVLLVSISACVFAVLLPIQTYATLYLQGKRLPKSVLPRPITKYFLMGTFIFQCVMAFLVLYYVVFKLG